jgi:hypothetical protein
VWSLQRPAKKLIIRRLVLPLSSVKISRPIRGLVDLWVEVVMGDRVRLVELL